MAKLGTAQFKGVKATYTFDVHPVDATFGDIGAVYIFARAEGDDHEALYVGQTGALGARLANHEKLPSVREHNGDRICVLGRASEAGRKAVESDLIAGIDPPCNKD